MEPVLQTIIVITVIAACAVYAIRLALRSVTGRKTGCGCAECPALKDKPRASSPAISAADASAEPKPASGHDGP
ncbi:MAG: FeoB-associated Cys-rich membrane protein [Planctomycetes bacterium]|nr:FeoB-associated Cys-rich membrane protein [Planctomycetota bacterium]